MAKEPTQFTLIVEGKTTDITKPTPIDLEMNNLRWDGNSPPDIVVMPGGLMLVKVGRYISEGNRYAYRMADVAYLSNGRLEKYL